ncbi:NADP-dependent oxidoreductase domain-containing protein [Dipodascopsis uninucleata]
MSICTTKFKLNDGYDIPAVGLGTWQGQPGTEAAEELINSIVYALQNGYRHIDTASGYQVEEYVGKAVKKSGIPRSEVFITTKLGNTDHGKVEEAFLKSLDLLDSDYIDLYLMHWPQSILPNREPSEIPTFQETWKSMVQLREKYPDKLRSIGVSNFSIKTLEELLPTTTVVPAVNQVELHPMLPQIELVEYMAKKGIHCTCYSPLGQYNSPILTHLDITSIAERHGVTPAQVALAWEVSRGLSVCPKSSNQKRIVQNITLPQLTDEELISITNFHRKPNMHRTLCTYNGHPTRRGETVLGWTFERLGWDISTTEP